MDWGMNFKFALKSVYNEIKLYNICETFLFIKHQRSFDERTYSKQLLYRENLYSGYSEKKKKRLFSQIYQYVMGRKLDVDAPKSWSEKIQWIKQ